MKNKKELTLPQSNDLEFFFNTPLDFPSSHDAWDTDDFVSDEFINQVSKHRRVRNALKELCKSDLIIIVEFYYDKPVNPQFKKIFGPIAKIIELTNSIKELDLTKPKSIEKVKLEAIELLQGAISNFQTIIKIHNNSKLKSLKKLNLNQMNELKRAVDNLKES